MLFVLILLVSSVHSKPHSQRNTPEENVQVEKQEIMELRPDAYVQLQNTKEILDNIKKINQNSALLPNTDGKHEAPPSQRVDFAKQQQYRIPHYPFSNPIFDYLQSQSANSESQQYQLKGYINPDNQIPGQYIKRKIIHQQTVIIPGFNDVMGMYNNANGMSHYFQAPAFANQPSPQPPAKQTLENDSIQNVRNIINNQMPGFLINPYYNYPMSGQGNEMEMQQLQRQGFWQSPLSQYFPIIIKDPLQQIVNAFTTMIEYGTPSNASPSSACIDESKHNPTKNRKYANGREVLIEDLQLTNDQDAPLQFTVKLDSRKDSRLVKNTKQNTPSRLNNKLQSLANILHIQQDTNQSSNSEEKLSLFPIGTTDKLKNLSQDNTGSGMYVHKLRVREGGIAIAGPGGIATAGSGGTAIVGPDGFAFTQPDSLAIAGSGTKVVAVNPGINLSELVETINKNDTEVNARIGRIVAIGPVIYYNKG